MVASASSDRASQPREPVSAVLKRRVVKSAEQRRADILDAAVRLFGVRGFNETTVEEIAEAAGVAKGTIYLYFPSKDHILMALKKRFHEGLQARCAEVIGDAFERQSSGEPIDYRDAIDDIFDAIVAHNVENRDAVEVVVRQSFGPDLVQEALALEKDVLQLMAAAFQQAMELGLIHTSDPEMMAYIVNAAMRDNIVTCLCYEEPASLDRFVAAVKELLYKALAPEPLVSLPPRRPRLVAD